jgi:hypothetical protein
MKRRDTTVRYDMVWYGMVQRKKREGCAKGKNGEIEVETNEPFVLPSRRAQTAPFTEETVPSYRHGRIARGRGAGRRGRLRGACEVAADHGLGLDDSLAA